MNEKLKKLNQQLAKSEARLRRAQHEEKILERIQNLRKNREVTQEQLAIDLNISDRYMRNLEKGEKVPSVDLFVELRERFGSSLDYIVLGVSASQREQELQDQLQMLRKELKEMQRRILVMLEMLGESA